LNQPIASGLDDLRLLAHVPARTWKVFAICLIGVTFANLDHSLFNYVLTEFKEEFGWSDEARGWYIAITYIIAGLIVTQIGVLTDRLGRRRTLLGVTLITPIFVAALTWVPSTALLLVFRTLGFATAGAQSPITVTTVLEESPARLRGLFSGVLQIGFPLGYFLGGYLLVPWVYTTFGWRYIFLLGFLFLPYAWIIYRYLDEPEAWVKVNAAREAGEADQPSIRELFRPGIRRKTLLLFTGQFLSVFAIGASTLLTAYFRESRGWGAEQAIETVAISMGVAILGYITAAFVGEFLISRRNTIVIWCLLASVAFIPMLWFATGFSATLIAFCVLTFFFYGSYAVIATFIAENFPAELRATATSFAGSFAVNLGFGLGPLALSYIYPVFGWEWGLTWTAAVPIAIAGIVFLASKPVPREMV